MVCQSNLGWLFPGQFISMCDLGILLVQTALTNIKLLASLFTLNIAR